MIDTIYATKKGMSQVWDVAGKRWPITKLVIEPNIVVGEVQAQVKTDKKDATSWQSQRIVEVGYGRKKLKNMTKPLRARLEKASVTQGVRVINGVRVAADEQLAVGTQISVSDLVKVGAIVQVQGTTKGRGFAGGMKRHGFQGGPKTHGQSDRWRAVGSVGNRTTPGRVWLGKRLPGHYGVETQTVKGLVVAHYDDTTRELWLTGPVPGAFDGIVAIKFSGKMKKDFALDKQASGLEENKATDQAAAPTTNKSDDAATQAASSAKDEPVIAKEEEQ